MSECYRHFDEALNANMIESNECTILAEAYLIYDFGHWRMWCLVLHGLFDIGVAYRSRVQIESCTKLLS